VASELRHKRRDGNENQSLRINQIYLPHFVIQLTIECWELIYKLVGVGWAFASWAARSFGFL